MNPRYINYIIHILAWSGLLLLPYIVSNSANEYRIGVMPGLFFTITGFIHMGIFYANAFYLYPKLFNRRYWWLYIPACIALISISFRLKFYVLAAWFPDVLQDEEGYKFIFAPSVIVFFASIVYRRTMNRIHFEKEQKERQAALLLTELKFLRSQISPHFLFNVLTNLVSLARKKSDRLEAALIMLSDLVRYMLYDTQGKKVALSKEVEYLKSYIELQKLRFGNDVNIECHIELTDGDIIHTIEPMLLIPFVENAFKHGVGYNGDPEICIRLSVNKEILYFEVQNRFNGELYPKADEDTASGLRSSPTGAEGYATRLETPASLTGGAANGTENSGLESSGIGLGNVRSRLNLLYNGTHTLKISNTNNLFHIHLTLNLA